MRILAVSNSGDYDFEVSPPNTVSNIHYVNQELEGDLNRCDHTLMLLYQTKLPKSSWEVVKSRDTDNTSEQ
jgi:hypothetical protein